MSIRGTLFVFAVPALAGACPDAIPERRSSAIIPISLIW